MRQDYDDSLKAIPTKPIKPIKPRSLDQFSRNAARCQGCTIGVDCEWTGGDDGRGHKWITCWTNGTDTFFDFDAAASLCLTNLHHKRSDKCISIAGSSCAMDYGGGIADSHIKYVGKKLNHRASKTIKAAIRAFIGHSDIDLHSGITFAEAYDDFSGTDEEMTVFGSVMEC